MTKPNKEMSQWEERLRAVYFKTMDTIDLDTDPSGETIIPAEIPSGDVKGFMRLVTPILASALAESRKEVIDELEREVEELKSPYQKLAIKFPVSDKVYNEALFDVLDLLKKRKAGL